MSSRGVDAARVYEYPATREMISGPGSIEALAEQAKKAGAERVFAVTTAHAPELPGRLEELLGARLVGVASGVAMHVLRESVISVGASVREAGADMIVSIGGGSVIDCAKGASLCLAYEIEETAQLDDFYARREDGVFVIPVLSRELVLHVAAPTTLSGAESTRLFGSTDTKRQVKHVFSSPRYSPRTIILDPELTATTPPWLWASSGMRAVDHAVEGVLSINPSPIHDAAGLEGLRILGERLAASASAPGDMGARLDCQLGAWLAIYALGNSTTGLSHGIGHQLSAQFGMIHGVTSAVLLPHVMEFNRELTLPQLRRIAVALGRDVADLGDEEAAEAGIQAVRELIWSLEQFDVPNTLQTAGANREGLAAVAANAMEDPVVRSNPRPVAEPDILALLESAWAAN